MTRKLVVTLVLFLSGCVRDVAIWRDGDKAVLPISFFNGLDFHGGMNGVDTVDNRRTTLAAQEKRTIQVRRPANEN